jgi:uncharacterized membrane protein YfbV (UPF0208 family)
VGVRSSEYTVRVWPCGGAGTAAVELFFVPSNGDILGLLLLGRSYLVVLLPGRALARWLHRILHFVCGFSASAEILSGRAQYQRLLRVADRALWKLLQVYIT